MIRLDNYIKKHHGDTATKDQIAMLLSGKTVIVSKNTNSHNYDLGEIKLPHGKDLSNLVRTSYNGYGITVSFSGLPRSNNRGIGNNIYAKEMLIEEIESVESLMMDVSVINSKLEAYRVDAEKKIADINKKIEILKESGVKEATADAINFMQNLNMSKDQFKTTEDYFNFAKSIKTACDNQARVVFPELNDIFDDKSKIKQSVVSEANDYSDDPISEEMDYEGAESAG